MSGLVPEIHNSKQQSKELLERLRVKEIIYFSDVKYLIHKK